jgi:hypothetical protein
MPIGSSGPKVQATQSPPTKTRIPKRSLKAMTAIRCGNGSPLPFLKYVNVWDWPPVRDGGRQFAVEGGRFETASRVGCLAREVLSPAREVLSPAREVLSPACRWLSLVGDEECLAGD